MSLHEGVHRAAATERPPVSVYVPNLSASAGLARDAHGIDPGSGIVGTVIAAGLQIDFEGNRFRAANMITFADRVLHAADRQAVSYPTVARRIVRREAFWKVGVFTPGQGIDIGDDGQELSSTTTAVRLFRIARWLGLVEEPGELEDAISDQLLAELQVSS